LVFSNISVLVDNLGKYFSRKQQKNLEKMQKGKYRLKRDFDYSSINYLAIY